MGLSTGKDLHIDNHLSNVAINYRPQEMIADMIAPIVPVGKQSDSFPVFSRFENFAIESTERAPRTEAKKITRSVSSQNYVAKNQALGYDIPIEDTANMDDVLRYELETGATKFLVGKLGLGWEKRLLDLAVTTANVGSVFVCNSAWNAPIGANQGDPITQLFQLQEYIWSTTGQKPNSILWGWRAWNYFRRNVNARNFFNGTNNGQGLVTRRQIQDMLEVDRFLVSQTLFHTQNEATGIISPTAAMSLQNPLQNSVILYFAPMGPSRDDPSWMYSFRWQAPQLPTPFAVERHPYDTRRKVETIEAGYYQAEQVVGADYAGRLLVNVASGAAGLG